MIQQQLKKLKIPDLPGVYFFVGKNKKVLYIGKATSLRDRIKSYFTKDIPLTRGEYIQQMVQQAKTVRTVSTDSVLEALICESAFVKKWKPKYNSDLKDDKSFNYISITKENYPRVILVRGRELEAGAQKGKPLRIKYSFGPFPKGGELREALKIIRKIFPYRDSSCVPLDEGGTGKPCFSRQIGICPGTCVGAITKEEYRREIKNLKLFLEGKKARVVKNIEREMKKEVKTLNFERAAALRRILFSLTHIQDVALMKREVMDSVHGEYFRLEAYDIAHLGGSNSVGVMTVVENGEVNKNEYRKFRMRLKHKGDDLAAIKETLSRRFNHPEWRRPNIIVIDGGETHRKSAESLLSELGEQTPVLAVVKDEKHRPRDVLGNRSLANRYQRDVLLANSEAHRFAIAYHRNSRSKNFISR